MNKKSVLVVSNPETIKPDFLQWISDTDTFDMTFADTQEQAIELSSQQLFDLVIIDKTDAEVNVKKLGKILPILNSEVLLVGYEGESSEKIEEKIRMSIVMETIDENCKVMQLTYKGSHVWRPVGMWSWGQIHHAFKWVEVVIQPMES